MSKKYRDEKPKNMREWCQRPGAVDENGNLQYFTEQSHKKECDVNEIIKKYDRTGLITHVAKFEAKFGDLTGADFTNMQNQVARAKSMFEELPHEIRKEFNNKPAELLAFMENPDNREKAIELGLIDPAWTPETDGLGEHVKLGENKTAESAANKAPEQIQTELPMETTKNVGEST